jgi:hypothetical protein
MPRLPQSQYPTGAIDEHTANSILLNIVANIPVAGQRLRDK